MSWVVRRLLVAFGLAGSIIVASSMPAWAAAPAAGTQGVTVKGPETAVVYGLADPWGPQSTIHVSVARKSEAWCVSAGKEGVPRSTAPVALGSGNVIIEVFIQVDGLTPGTEYCAELVVENEDGIGHGGQASFSTPALLGWGRAPAR
jgi:hypothetical protein